MAQISKKEISPHKSLQLISLEEEVSIETLMSTQKAQPESIVFLPKGSKRVRVGTEMKGRVGDSVKHGEDNGDNLH